MLQVKQPQASSWSRVSQRCAFVQLHLQHMYLWQSMENFLIIASHSRVYTSCELRSDLINLKNPPIIKPASQTIKHTTTARVCLSAFTWPLSSPVCVISSQDVTGMQFLTHTHKLSRSSLLSRTFPDKDCKDRKWADLLDDVLVVPSCYLGSWNLMYFFFPAGENNDLSSSPEANIVGVTAFISC